MVTALYDGYCVICQTTRRIIQSIDWFGRVEFLDLHDTHSIQARYPQLTYEDLMGEINVMADDTRYVGFDGMRRMLRETPLGFPLWLCLMLPGMSHAGPFIYRFIARNRYAINRFFGVELEPDQDCIDGVCKIPHKHTNLEKS